MLGLDGQGDRDNLVVSLVDWELRWGGVVFDWDPLDPYVDVCIWDLHARMEAANLSQRVQEAVDLSGGRAYLVLALLEAVKLF